MTICLGVGRYVLDHLGTSSYYRIGTDPYVLV
ncbi:unnamed protein product, partial [marine sediment metagenome]